MAGHGYRSEVDAARARAAALEERLAGVEAENVALRARLAAFGAPPPPRRWPPPLPGRAAPGLTRTAHLLAVLARRGVVAQPARRRDGPFRASLVIGAAAIALLVAWLGYTAC